MFVFPRAFLSHSMEIHVSHVLGTARISASYKKFKKYLTSKYLWYLYYSIFFCYYGNYFFPYFGIFIDFPLTWNI